MPFKAISMLNNPERLAAIVEHSELIASVAECSADVEHNQLLKRQKKDKEEADKKRKKKEEILPALTANVLKYANRAKEVDQDTLMKEMNEEFKKTFLVDILVYYYGMKKGDASSQ